MQAQIVQETREVVRTETVEMVQVTMTKEEALVLQRFIYNHIGGSESGPRGVFQNLERSLVQVNKVYNPKPLQAKCVGVTIYIEE